MLFVFLFRFGVSKQKKKKFFAPFMFVFSLRIASFPFLPLSHPIDGQSSLFACDFESAGRRLCGWNIDPRDNGAIWSIAWNSQLRTNAVCLAATRSGGHAADTTEISSDEPFMRAKLWSPKLRVAKMETSPRCIQFAFSLLHQPRLIEETTPFSLSLLRHSSR